MSTAVRVGVVGVGYVGLTTAVCIAERGLDTVAVDVDPQRVDQLRSGIPVIDEPELPELLRDGLAAGLLRFSGDYATLADRDIVFVCVPTPSADDGRPDLSAVHSAVDRLGEVLCSGAIVAMKSTIPVGTTSVVAERLRDRGFGRCQLLSSYARGGPCTISGTPIVSSSAPRRNGRRRHQPHLRVGHRTRLPDDSGKRGGGQIRQQRLLGRQAFLHQFAGDTVLPE